MLRGTRRDLLARAVIGSAAIALTGCSDAPARRGRDAATGAAPLVVRPASGSLRGGTRVVITGSGLGAARTATVDGRAVDLARRGDASVVLVPPAATDYRAGAARIVLHDGDGAQVAAAAWSYEAVDGVDRQLQYLLRHWKDYNPAYPRLGDTDCVDFASQSLIQRGWRQQGEWTHADPVESSGGAWISSTLFRDFMVAHPDLGTALTDEQRARVRLGDVVQFDWDRSGDRDHTGVITRITREGERIRIAFAGHTEDSDYRDVDEAITVDHPGGEVHYWSIA